MKNSYDTQLPAEAQASTSAYKPVFKASCSLNQVFLPPYRGKMLELCGRICAKRCLGAVAFADLYDNGIDIQIVFQRDSNFAAWSFFKTCVSVGDYVGLCGIVAQTQNGTDSVFVAEMSLLTKSVSALPDKYHGVHSSQVKRQTRYLDVLTNRDAYCIFLQRSIIQQKMRNVLIENGYLEMDTPILSTVPCASNARQFQAHHNDLDCPVYLRVSSELALKQLVLSGYTRVFEFCRNFRNEGSDRFHRQEFLNLEIYCAYTDLDQMKLLVKELLTACCGESGILRFDGKALSICDIPTYHVYDLILDRSGIDILELNELEHLKEAMLAKGIVSEDQIFQLGNRNACVNRLVDWLLDAEGLYYLKGYPAELYPLCRVCGEDVRFADMEYLYLGDMCLAQFCGEETDPSRLKRMLEMQAAQSEKQVEADPAFLTAASYGMPPMCGIGISMERLIMLLCGAATIYDTNFFHLNKP